MINEKHLSLNFSQEQCTKAWQKTENYSNSAAHWNAYLNSLCLSVLSDYWMTQETDLFIPEQSENWELVNGSFIQDKRTQIILIPHETIDTEAFFIPQEWIDIPTWIGSYYVAVQILPDEGYLRVWGFTTHAQIKTEGIYDSATRTYSLSRESLTEDINGLWVLNKFGLSETIAVDNFIQLSDRQATTFIDSLSHIQSNLPRLELAFSDWGALLSNSKYKHHLYLSRLAHSQASKQTIVQPSLVNPVKKLTQLSYWLKGIFEQDWHSFETILRTEENTLAYALRNRLQPLTTSEITDFIQQIYTGNLNQQKQAAQKLGSLSTEQPEVIKALDHLIQTTKDEETRWTAAESLWTLSPEHPAAGIRRLKNLGIQMGGHYLALMVAILPKPEQKFAILLRVYPMGTQRHLPDNLELIILDEQQQLFLRAKSRKIDNYIQLKFSGNNEEKFSVKLVYGSIELRENFII